MKHLFTAAMLLLATTFSFTANAQKISVADSTATAKVYLGMMMAFGSSDASAIAGYYTENGTHVSPDGQIVTGRAALKNHYEKLFAWFKTLPKPDKSDFNERNWNVRYLSDDLIMVNYIQDHTRYFGNKAEKEAAAMSIILKRTKDGWLCEQMAMTPVKPMQ